MRVMDIVLDDALLCVFFFKQKTAYEMRISDWSSDVCSSDLAIASALTRLARGTLLSPDSTEYLLDVMSRTRSGPRRLKAGLPAGWQFLHKTGTGQDYKGSPAGDNDIGIATAPDGTGYAIAVLLGDHRAPVPAPRGLMQRVRTEKR